MWVYSLASLRFLAVNEAAIVHYGYTRDEFLGLTIKDIRPEEDVPALLGAVARVTDGLITPKPWRHRTKSGKIIWVEISSHTLDFGGQRAELVLAHDITGRQQAEARVQYLNRVYAVLSDINQTIVRERAVDKILSAACRIAVEKGRFRMAWVGLASPVNGRLEIAAAAGADPATLHLLADLIAAEPPAGCHFTRRALAEGVHGICEDIATDRLADAWREAALERGYRTMAAFPLKMSGVVCGVMNFYAEDIGIFDTDEVLLLDELALDIGFALELDRSRAEHNATETRMARQRATLVALARRRTLDVPDLLSVLGAINEAAAATLTVARVSIWLYSADRLAIECVDLFEAGVNRHSRGAKLGAGANPAYFRALEELELIAADDALTDPSTREFADKYLTPLGIGAMLDAPISVGGARVGVLCHEHLGTTRHWTQDECTFAVAMANHVALALESADRNVAEAARKESLARLETVVRATNDAVWDWDLRSDLVWWSEGFGNLFGYPANVTEPKSASWTARVHPEDKARVLQSLMLVVESDLLSWKDEYRFQRRDQSYALVLDRGHVLRDERKRAVRMIGAMQDVTEQRSSETKIRAQLNELLRWQRVTVAREQRIQQLKAEVNEALLAQGKPLRYVSQLQP